jgi:hypothetical protein
MSRPSLWRRSYRSQKKSLFVIPSEARDLLSLAKLKKNRFLGHTRPFGMTNREFFRSRFSLWVSVPLP